MVRIFCVALIAFAVTACQNSGSQKGATLITPNTQSPFNFQPIAASSQQAGTLPATGNTGAVNPAHGQPGHRCDIPDGAPLNTAPISTTIPATTTTGTTTTPATTTTAATTNAALNPAHGQPGHRCDISVGAPMNSAPATTTAPTTTAASTTTTTQPTTAAVKTTSTTKPGMNPAHGEPGHRCDISVGAPLNSAPATTSTTTAPTTTPTTAATTPSTVPSVTQVLPSAPASSTTDKNVKLNPAHGQPGHDCSIAVGQPLKN